MKQINIEIAKKIIEMVIENHKENKKMKNALNRNYALTSEYDLPKTELDVYKEGFLLKLIGTRCQYRVFVKDNDGELEIMDKKPNENKLNKIYTDYENTWHIYTFD